VLHHTISLQDPVQGRQGPAAVYHVVLGNNLEPINNRLLFEDMRVVGNAEADSYPVIFKPVKSKKWGQPGGLGPRGSTFYFFEPSVAQPPFPLQEFLPLQPLSLALQPPLPLQEFLPSQACLSLAALVVVESSPLSEDIVGLELPDDGAAFKRAIVPPSNPVKAAVSIREFLLIFIAVIPLFSNDRWSAGAAVSSMLARFDYTVT
jgi:hypothetical protein